MVHCVRFCCSHVEKSKNKNIKKKTEKQKKNRKTHKTQTNVMVWHATAINQWSINRTNDATTTAQELPSILTIGSRAVSPWRTRPAWFCIFVQVCYSHCRLTKSNRSDPPLYDFYIIFFFCILLSSLDFVWPFIFVYFAFVLYYYSNDLYICIMYCLTLDQNKFYKKKKESKIIPKTCKKLL